MAIHMDLLARSFPNMDTLFLNDIWEGQRLLPAQIPSMDTLCVTYNDEVTFREIIGVLQQNYLLKHLAYKHGHFFTSARTLFQVIGDELTGLEELLLIGYECEIINLKNAVRFFRRRTSLKRFQFNAPEDSKLKVIQRALDGAIKTHQTQDYTITSKVGRIFKASFVPKEERYLLECDYCSKFVVTLTKIYSN